MKGIFVAIDFKGIDENLININYFKSLESRIIKKENFIFVIGKNNVLTKSDYFSDDRYELVSVSRIDNKEDLLKEFNLSKETSNSKLILFLFKKFKTHAFNKIFGGFSTVIIDKKFNKIKAFSDHLNQKPLFYSKRKSNFFFSTSIETLFQSGVKRNQICEEVLLDLLVCGAPRVNKTIYKNINILPNNGFLKLNKKENLKIKKFYTFKKLTTNHKNTDYYQKNVKRIFFKTIEEQLVQADKNISLALSGGLDSSSVVCVANNINKEKRLNKNLSTNSAIFPSLKEKDKQKADETNFIELVLNGKNLNHNYYCFSNKGSLSILDELTNFNEPMMGPNAYINFSILEKIKLKKHNVFFDGNGGDNTISHGYSRLLELGRKFDFYNLFIEYKNFCRKKKIKFSLFNLLKRFVLFQLIPDFVHRYIYSRKKNRLDIFNLNLILKKNKKINILKRIEKVYGHHPRAAYSRKYPINFIEEKSVADIYNTYESRLNYELSENKEIEILSPFLDKRLIEFCLSVPLKEKLKNGEDRYYFRKAMKDIIPVEIEKRTSKADISPLFIEEILTFPLESILKIVFKRNSPLVDLLDKKLLEKLHHRFLEKKDVTLASFFYKLVYVGSWLNKRLT
tara:strand:- start:165 stop:2033 length:1869 start_codon:yes stop_codon:yes gene_type:complete